MLSLPKQILLQSYHILLTLQSQLSRQQCIAYGTLLNNVLTCVQQIDGLVDAYRICLIIVGVLAMYVQHPVMTSIVIYEFRFSGTEVFQLRLVCSEQSQGICPSFCTKALSFTLFLYKSITICNIYKIRDVLFPLAYA